MLRRLWRWYCGYQAEKYARAGFRLYTQYKYDEAVSCFRIANEWERRAL